MKNSKRNLICILSVCFFVCIISSSVQAMCWNPPCTSCERCVNKTCVSGGCPSGASCCDNRLCYMPSECQSCVGGDVVTCGGDHHQRCCDGTCCTLLEQCCCESGCTSTWYALDTVHRVDEVCSECSGGSCGTVEIKNSYQVWRETGAGEGGWCKNPTKTDVIGFEYDCAEDWDVSKIVACAAGVAGCAYLCGAPPWGQCVACLVGIGAACAADGDCGFVEECYLGDELRPIEETIVDWTGTGSFGRSCP